MIEKWAVAVLTIYLWLMMGTAAGLIWSGAPLAPMPKWLVWQLLRGFGVVMWIFWGI